MLVCPSCRHDNREGARFCEECGFSLGAQLAPTEQRRIVTVLFCDLVGSTALGETVDPERLRALLAGYFDRMRSIVERHGGSVEKFIGDAVMAVFGVPVLHEDDALRAVRAAVEMRDALPELGLQGRIGVMTGEVVAGTQERLATGDAVNVAARLEQAAQPGEVLIGEPTLALVRGAAEVEQVEPLMLKGKAEPTQAYRLLSVHDAPERHQAERFVGRARELRLVREALERVEAERRCDLVTIVGDAGIGKSRFVAEVIESVEAKVVRGRCLPYGEGITYWPVVEVLKQLDALPKDETAAMVIRSLLGESEVATSAEEIAWAVRKTLEQAATEGPLIVVFDDIQWGEETFRDLIEHVALLSSGAAILLLCMARPELAERHPTWPVTLRLEPLGDDDVAELIAERIPQGLRERVARAAGGNPLFIEEMLAMAGEADDEMVIPATLQALLAARLDQLDPAERGVLERASIEGEIFHRGAVQALSGDETPVTPRLAALVRKELIRPDKAQLAGEDGFRFRHLLLRDAAYEALPKALRGELHARLASWLEHHGAVLVERDELLGYHLAQACSYRDELGLPVDDELATAARRHLTIGGYRAQSRSDDGAAASLFERALALVPADEFDLALETELGDVLYWGGRGDEGLRRAESLTQRAAAAGNQLGELCGRIREASLRCYQLETEHATAELATLMAEALPVLEAAGDDVALYIGYSALGHVGHVRGKHSAALEAYERAVTHGQRAGLPQEFLGWRAAFRFYGPTPVLELLAWLDEHEPRAGRDQWLRSYRAAGLAMLGRFDEARAILADTRAELVERGGGLRLAMTIGLECTLVELIAGDPAAAVEFGEEGCRLFDELGDRGFLSSAAGNLAQALYLLDRLDEADDWAGRAAELGTEDDGSTQMLWRAVRAKVLARRGHHKAAEELAREAVVICETTDLLDQQGDVYNDLAEVLLLAGKRDDAAAAFGEALERHERKGNLVSAQRVRERRSELSA